MIVLAALIQPSKSTMTTNSPSCSSTAAPTCAGITFEGQGGSSFMETQARFWSKVQKGEGCWNWQAGISPRGYGRFSLNGTCMQAHRVAWLFTFGQIPEGLQVCHHCDNRKCCNPAHLFTGTNAENVADRHSKGRSNAPACEAHGMAKLDRQTVAQIRNATGSSRKVGARFGISKTHVLRIKNGNSWGAV